jgi:hypothetical protein
MFKFARLTSLSSVTSIACLGWVLYTADRSGSVVWEGSDKLSEGEVLGLRVGYCETDCLPKLSSPVTCRGLEFW